ncbi:MAG: hypothetical protein KDD44_00590 [Bdellovibrionales bacterium]|nr:hypothetical protein [Bdellovibrionales bacterium]
MQKGGASAPGPICCPPSTPTSQFGLSEEALDAINSMLQNILEDPAGYAEKHGISVADLLASIEAQQALLIKQKEKLAGERTT